MIVYINKVNASKCPNDAMEKHFEVINYGYFVEKVSKFLIIEDVIDGFLLVFFYNCNVLILKSQNEIQVLENITKIEMYIINSYHRSMYFKLVTYIRSSLPLRITRYLSPLSLYFHKNNLINKIYCHYHFSSYFYSILCKWWLMFLLANYILYRKT